MTIHLCQSSEKLNWNKIKKSILGLNRSSHQFTCAGCSQSFETICCLHFHCMKHNEGGSYFFDHVTNTAFPKLDTRCSSTQFEADDFNEDGKNDFKVLMGNARSVSLNKPEEASLTSLTMKGNNSGTKHSDCSVKNTSDENDITESDKQDAESTIEQSLVKGTREEEREGFAKVKVRNIEKREDGSIIFEMSESDAHLFQVTANTLIEQMKEKNGDLLISHQELEVKVPDDSLKHAGRHGGTSVSSYQILAVSGVSQIHGSAHIGTDIQEDVNIDKASIKDNEVRQDNVERFKLAVHKSKEMGISSGSEGIINEKRSNELKDVTNEAESNKMIEQDVDYKTDKTDSSEQDDELVDKNEGSSLVPELPIYTRSQRKRKLTAKMIESELPDILKMTKRKPLFQEIIYERNVSKRSKRQILPDKTDFNAGETLLSLRGTGNQKSVRSSRSKTGIAVVSKKNTASIGDKTRDFEENHYDSSDSKKVIDTDIEKIIMKDIIDPEEDFEKDQCGMLPRYKDASEETGDDKDWKTERDQIIYLKKNVLKFKKQREKRLNSGQVPKRKRNDLKCNVCGKVGSLSMMKYHEEMHSDKMPYKCEHCGKCFKTAACKRSHTLQHGEKRWKCELCPAAFFRKQYLDVHMTNHTGEYPFVCEICGMKFKMAYIVRRHVKNVHKNIRDYKCDFCGKEFFRLATRDLHRNRHFDPFLQCSYCPKKFKGDLDLRKHELTHTGEKMYFCPICKQGFTQIWPYYKHMWKIHNIEKEEAKKVRIRNPDIVNMRNINKVSVKKESGNMHEFIGKPGGNFDMNKGFIQNIKQLKMNENMDQSECENRKVVGEGNVQNEGNVVYTSAESVSDAIDVVYTSAEAVSNAIDVVYTSAETVPDAIDVVYTSAESMSDAIVMNIGEQFDDQETIVIQTEELQTVNGQQTGYIVLENAQTGENIVIYSDLPQHETENVHEFINC